MRRKVTLPPSSGHLPPFTREGRISVCATEVNNVCKVSTIGKKKKKRKKKGFQNGIVSFVKFIQHYGDINDSGYNLYKSVP